MHQKHSHSRFPGGECHPDHPRFVRGPHGHDNHHRSGRQGRLGRFFAHGDLRLVILALIAEKPRHGYDIIKAIEERVGGAYSPSPGVVYPTLTLLEEIGHVRADVDGAKKLHSVTAEGAAFLDANRSAVNALLARIAEAGQARSSAEAAPVLRGMENLKLALRLRVSRGPLSDEQIRHIAAALDAAAITIEQS